MPTPRTTTVAAINLKGGVGKTTSAIHLAMLWSRTGSVLLVDADPQASAWEFCQAVGEGLPFSAVLQPVRNLHSRLNGLSAGFDYVVIDTPPGDEAIVRSAALGCDLALVPMAPSTYDAARFAPTLELLAQVDDLNGRLRYRILLTKVRAGTRSGPDLRAELAQADLPVLTAEIPLRERYARGYGELPDEVALEPYAAVIDELSTVGVER